MNPAGTHSGKFGLVNGVPSTRKWSITDNQTLAKSVTSATAFGEASRAGVEEWSGQYENQELIPTHMPGDVITFAGYEAPDNDAGGNGETYTGLAVISQLAIDWNWQGGDIIKNTVDFVGHLELTPAQAASVTAFLDASTPYNPSVLLAKWQYSTDDGSTFVDWTDMVSGNLTFVNAVQEFVNSSTIVTVSSVPHLWKGRRPGNMQGPTASVVEQNVDRSRFKKGQQLVLRCFIDATEYWEIKYVLVKSFEGITADRESGAIIQQTVNMEFNAADVTAGTLGHILKPDTTTYWPVAQT